jgi:chitodextrinase
VRSFHGLHRLKRRPALRLISAATIGVLFLLLAQPTQAAVLGQLTRYPYLSDLVQSWVTVNWATDKSATTGSVKWGSVSGSSCSLTSTTTATRTTITVNGISQYQWKAQLSLPSQGSRYCYRVYLGTADLLNTDPSPEFRSQLPSSSTGPFTFAVLGDWGAVDATGQNVHQANLMTQLAGSGALFAVSTGDQGYPDGDQRNFGDLYQTGDKTSGVFGPQFWAKVGARMPLFTTAGNHGLTNSALITNFPQAKAASTSSGQYAMQSVPSTIYGTAVQTQTNAWYAFDAGKARFYVLKAAWSNGNQGSAPGATTSQKSYANDYDAHWKPGRPEYQWLANDLATHPNAVKFAFFHNPMYSIQDTEASDTYLQGAGSLEGLLSQHGVDLIFNGHAHIYERNVPSMGMVTYVTGGGGADAQSFKAKYCKPFSAYAIGWSDSQSIGTTCGSSPAPTSKAQVYHYLLVSVEGTSVQVTPTNSLGQTFDPRTYDAGQPITDDNPPTAPGNLTGTATSTTALTLAWSASQDDTAIAGYNVYNADSSALLGTTSSTTFQVTGLLPNTTHRYYVTAQDPSGNVSAPSATVTVTTQAGPIIIGASADSTIDPAGPSTTSSRVKVDLSGPVNDALLRFVIPSGCTPSSAQLTLTVGSGSSDPSTKGGSFYATSPSDPNADWSEASVTWATAPLKDTTKPPAVIPGPVAVSSSYTVNVTALVPSTGGSFTIRGTSTSSDGAAYYSREGSSTSGPRLAVTCG